MNQNFIKLPILNNSGLGCFLSLILAGLFLGAVGLGWVVNGVLIFIAIVLLTPILAFWGLRWWIARNLVEDQCPSCGYEFTGFKQAECRCPSCGESLIIEGDRFIRLTPPGTIEVEAIDVTVKQIEDKL